MSSYQEAGSDINLSVSDQNIHTLSADYKLASTVDINDDRYELVPYIGFSTQFSTSNQHSISILGQNANGVFNRDQTNAEIYTGFNFAIKGSGPNRLNAGFETRFAADKSYHLKTKLKLTW